VWTAGQQQQQWQQHWQGGLVALKSDVGHVGQRGVSRWWAGCTVPLGGGARTVRQRLTHRCAAFCLCATVRATCNPGGPRPRPCGKSGLGVCVARAVVRAGGTEKCRLGAASGAQRSVQPRVRSRVHQQYAHIPLLHCSLLQQARRTAAQRSAGLT
jgi:hypothetical protein